MKIKHVKIRYIKIKHVKIRHVKEVQKKLERTKENPTVIIQKNNQTECKRFGQG